MLNVITGNLDAPGGLVFSDGLVDLDALEITAPTGLRLAFDFDAFERDCLLNGLDDVSLTLERDDAISAYEQTHAARFDTRALSG